MGGLALDVALDRLLRDRAYRADFLAGRWDALGLDAEGLDAVRAIDPEFLARTAHRLREEVRTRKHRGTGSLEDLFPKTIAAWGAAHPEDADRSELFSRFVESDAYASWRDVPHAGEGTSLEEAFYRFAEVQGVGDPAVREEEFLTAVVRALAVCPEPSFLVPPEVHRAPGGWFAVTSRGVPLLVAATRDSFAKGPVAKLLRDLFAPSVS